jgi:hypothetical protein
MPLAGTVCPSGPPEFIPGFQWGSYYSIFSSICMFCRSLFVILSFFFLAIVLSVLRFMDSNYPFGIFKHSLIQHASCGIVTERNMIEV